MNRRLSIVLLLLIAAACADTSTPPPVTTPANAVQFIIDPRTGFEGTPNPKFDAAWRAATGGDAATAHRRLEEILAADPNYGPALVAEAAIALNGGQLDEARTALDRVRAQNVANYTAADVYEAELAIAQHQPRRAYELYRDVATRANAPAEAAERVTKLRTEVFEQLFHDAQAAPATESIRLLREALTINPGATDARVMLVQRLVSDKSYDEARRELEPLLDSGAADRTEVQEALAEFDAGRGRYQEAIVRFERLQRRAPSPRYAQRLDEIKEQFAAANMPPQYQRAVESQAIDRADFAVLLYWKVASVRFAQNLGTPPIAIDVAEVPGREELIRAIALGVLQVDPITRRVGPGADISAASLARLVARVLTVRGASCARGVGDTAKILAACGISDPTTGTTSDAPVTGRAAAAVLEQVDKALSR